jgi:hypothetical protein
MEKLEQRISVETDALLVNGVEFTRGTKQYRDSGLYWTMLSMANIIYGCYGAGRQQHFSYFSMLELGLHERPFFVI